MNDTIGVDISKDHLDVHRMNDGKSRRFTNDKVGHREFINWLADPGVCIVYEPTGPYHRTFERRLATAGCALVKVRTRTLESQNRTNGVVSSCHRVEIL